MVLALSKFFIKLDAKSPGQCVDCPMVLWLLKGKGYNN